MDHLSQIAAEFRLYADKDYLASRTLFRNKCLDHFLYMSHHTTEKYLKAILLYSKVSIKKTHSLISLLTRVDQNVKYFSLSERSRQFINSISDYNNIRYPDFPFYGDRNWLFSLDRLVKELRFFSQSPETGVIQRYVASSMQADSFEKYVLDPTMRLFTSGHLENVLKNNKGKYVLERKNLVWNNFYYAGRKRKVVKFRGGFWSRNNYLFGCGGSKWQKEVYNQTKGYLKYSGLIEKYFKSIDNCE